MADGQAGPNWGKKRAGYLAVGARLALLQYTGVMQVLSGEHRSRAIYGTELSLHN